MTLASAVPPTPRPDELFDSAGVAFDVEMSDLEYRPHHKQRTKCTARRLRWTRCAVFSRDEWRCRHCGQEFTHDDPIVACGAELPTLKIGQGRVKIAGGDFLTGPVYVMRPIITCLTLDHVVPYLHGGPFKVANLQALCDRCNSRKGATV